MLDGRVAFAVGTLGIAAVALALAACGGRSGLDVGGLFPEPDGQADATTAGGSVDGGARDAALVVDAGAEARACVPACAQAAVCGADDGCGGPCAVGVCPAGEACVAGRCAGAVLFGGRGPDGALLDDTWIWSGHGWTAAATAPAPSARAYHAMASAGGRVVLFGGRTAAGDSAETWEWDGSRWTRILGTPAPLARFGHAMATLGDRAVLFGGQSRSGPLDDTWVYAPGAGWSRASPAESPPWRYSHAMAAIDGGALLFGGLPNRVDAWSWTGASWTALGDQGFTAFGEPMASSDGAALLFGVPFDGGATPTYGWTGRWTELHRDSIAPRRFAAMAPEPGGHVVLFGGAGTGPDGGIVTYGDTWSWTGTAWSNDAVAGPPERAAHAMALRQGPPP